MVFLRVIPYFNTEYFCLFVKVVVDANSVYFWYYNGIVFHFAEGKAEIEEKVLCRVSGVTTGGGTGGQLPPQMKGLPPQLPPQSKEICFFIWVKQFFSRELVF